MKLACGILGAGALAYTAYSFPRQSSRGFAGIFRFRDLQLESAESIAPNAKKYTFKFEDPEATPGFLPGSFVVAKLKTPHGTIFRPYTPISSPDAKGFVEFAIKTYPNGKMSSAMDSLKHGDSVSFMGPIRAYAYKPNEVEHISLIAGGSGITPMFQLLRSVAENPADHTRIDLFYGSDSEDGILLKNEIDDIVGQNKDRIKVHYFVSKPSTEWTGNTGRLSKEYLQQHMPSPSTSTKVFVCGPAAFYKAICGNKPNPIIQGPYSGILKELGYSQKQVFKF